VQAGQPLAVTVRGVTALDGRSCTSGAAARFFRPGRDPERTAGLAPDAEVPLRFDPASRTWRAQVRTDGWEPGTWTLQGVVLDPAGDVAGWAWYRFGLDP